jgi:hypothetical protein
MDEFRISGQTVRSFRQRKEISEGTFFAWRKRLSKRSASAVSNGRGGQPMIPVEVVQEEREPYRDKSSPSLAGRLEIVTPGGCRLRFDRSLEPSYMCDLLQSVLRVESGADSC